MARTGFPLTRRLGTGREFSCFLSWVRMTRPTTLEHVPNKLLDFFDQDMLQLFEFERFIFDHVIPRDREAL